MDVRFEEQQGILVVIPLEARIDAIAAPAFRATVGDKAAGRSAVVLDLTAVTFIDSSGLAAVISVLKRLAPGGSLRIAAPPPAVKTLLQVTRLQKIFPSFPTVAQALQG